ncbi:uncharacterized protein NFIA_060750 [Aspergillus fischeri NRRL 181]|uniref:Uncharacterized protein n=1 Tax=Neosartorya fischeri (strain ATCC 1020 / DSM 3700 / CBS 544.65 / FGSC A1164 / JCM 1740 / NRRL 181 / WB 181) TaxID=331117 RepID=A1DPJ8_NEOFI|nr:conserved hypothetical protein [Aspergillus fischeri NRRL 181]EAW16719.1 conserved hypothetical protein [Aspergillus fischeri NRRL 181]KAG2002875.1 hypothetical protein GB937_009411 [Aspergillus fischeri]
MASQHIQVATPPSKDAILESLVENVRACNARLPPGRDNIVFGACELEAEMPLLLNRPGAPLPCREPPAEFETVNAHFSAQMHAFFNALHDLEDMADKPSSDDLDLCRPDECLRPVICVSNQSFEPHLDCLHRAFHTRRLTVQNPDSLPLLNRVTQLRILPDRDSTFDPINMRPVSLRTPLELATRLPQLRELDCPWLWERLPIAFTSKALRIISRVWAGPWRDDRAEFARAVRHAMPLLPSSLTKVRLWFWRPSSHWDEVDQAAQMPDLVGASSSSSTNEFEGMDPVSLGLRDLGSRLEELDVCALITPDLFPSGGDGLSWPHMRHLNVEFHPCAPDGSWYFSGPRGEDPHATGFAITREEHYPPGQEDDDETHELMSDEEEEYQGDAPDIYDLRNPDMFRLRPIAERINPLLLAFALSLQLQKMPALRDAELFTWLTRRPSKERAKEYEGSDDVPPTSYEEETVMFRWGVRYEAPAVGGDGKGKVTWQVDEDWRPEDGVIKAFEDLVGGDGGNMEWNAFEFVEEREQDPEDYI